MLGDLKKSVAARILYRMAQQACYRYAVRCELMRTLPEEEQLPTESSGSLVWVTAAEVEALVTTLPEEVPVRLFPFLRELFELHEQSEHEQEQHPYNPNWN